MEAKELRIGNYINEEFWNGQNSRFEFEMIKVRDVLESHIVDEEDIAYGYEEVKPIKLTESLLMNFGFEEKEGDCLGSIWCLKGFNDYKSFEIVYDGAGIRYFTNANTVVDLDYVHQIQNLFFALTGNELKKVEKNKRKSFEA